MEHAYILIQVKYQVVWILIEKHGEWNKRRVAKPQKNVTDILLGGDLKVVFFLIFGKVPIFFLLKSIVFITKKLTKGLLTHF